MELAPRTLENAEIMDDKLEAVTGCGSFTIYHEGDSVYFYCSICKKLIKTVPNNESAITAAYGTANAHVNRCTG